VQREFRERPHVHAPEAIVDGRNGVSDWRTCQLPLADGWIDGASPVDPLIVDPLIDRTGGNSKTNTPPPSRIDALGRRRLV
jgi:hypothetical protein